MAEDALRAFTDRNFGRMCAMCARWTLFATQANASVGNEGTSAPVTWRVQSWVTNCCNANHALESMDESTLAGIVATREAGKAWWQKVKRAHKAPCAALTDQGCHLERGRPELCNKYFCEAVRDYLWLIGGDREGARLAARLDELQRRWGTLYTSYQAAIAGVPHAPADRAPAAIRKAAAWAAFMGMLDDFDSEIARCARPISTNDVTGRLFKVSGERDLYEPFFEKEMAVLEGRIRAPDAGRDV